MEPAWDQLTEAFENSKSKLIGEIDCTDEDEGGQELCQSMGIKSFPTLKFGDVFDLQEYEGPRDFESLKKFSDKQLKPTCGLNHIQLCDKATRQEIRRLKKLSLEELDKELTAKTDAINEIDAAEKEFVEGLEEQYEKAMADRETQEKEIKRSGLDLMRKCAAERGIDVPKPQKKAAPEPEGDDDEFAEYE